MLNATQLLAVAAVLSGSVQCAEWSPLQAGVLSRLPQPPFHLGSPQGHLGLRRTQRRFGGAANLVRHTPCEGDCELAIPALEAKSQEAPRRPSRAAASERERGQPSRQGALTPRLLGLMGASASQAGPWSLTSPLRSRDLYPESPSLASLPAPGPTSSHVIGSLHGGLAE